MNDATFVAILISLLSIVVSVVFFYCNAALRKHYVQKQRETRKSNLPKRNGVIAGKKGFYIQQVDGYSGEVTWYFSELDENSEWEEIPLSSMVRKYGESVLHPGFSVNDSKQHSND